MGKKLHKGRYVFSYSVTIIIAKVEIKLTITFCIKLRETIIKYPNSYK